MGRALVLERASSGTLRRDPELSMNSAMWRSLCDEIPPEATPHELHAALRHAEDEGLTENEHAIIRYLAVLIRASFTSSPDPDVVDLRQLRQPAPATDEDSPAR